MGQEEEKVGWQKVRKIEKKKKKGGVFMLLFLSQGIWGGLSAIPQGKKRKKISLLCGITPRVFRIYPLSIIFLSDILLSLFSYF